MHRYQFRYAVYIRIGFCKYTVRAIKRRYRSNSTRLHTLTVQLPVAKVSIIVQLVLAVRRNARHLIPNTAVGCTLLEHRGKKTEGNCSESDAKRD